MLLSLFLDLLAERLGRYDDEAFKVTLREKVLKARRTAIRRLYDRGRRLPKSDYQPLMLTLTVGGMGCPEPLAGNTGALLLEAELLVTGSPPLPVSVCPEARAAYVGQRRFSKAVPQLVYVPGEEHGTGGQLLVYPTPSHDQTVRLRAVWADPTTLPGAPDGPYGKDCTLEQLILDETEALIYAQYRPAPSGDPAHAAADA